MKLRLHLLFIALLATTPALAQPCGMWGNTPQQIGGCTVRDANGLPSVRLTQPTSGTGYRATPVPGYRPAGPAPSTLYRPTLRSPYGY